jgi:hypothetical protein
VLIAEREGSAVGCASWSRRADDASGALSTAARCACCWSSSRRAARHRRAPGRRSERFARARAIAGSSSDQQRPRRRRAIYAKAGYRLVASEPHESFGHRLVGET